MTYLLDVKKNQHAGFTLLEMMVTISIALVILSIAIFGWQGARQSATFDVAIEQLVSDISRARIDSLAGKIDDTQVPAGGYGIGFLCTAGSNVVDYCRYMDSNANGEIEEDEIIVAGNFTDLPFMSAPVEIEGLELDLFDTSVVVVNRATVTFRSPHALLVTEPDSSSMSVQRLRVVLSHESSGKIQTLVIDPVSGLLYVE